MMKLFICTLFIMFTNPICAKTHLYSGKVATFAKYQSIIAMHEHDVFYNADTNRIERKSYLEIINVDNRNENFTIKKTPMFLALDWTSDGKYLVGIANLNEHNNPHIVVYSSKGKTLAKVKLNCKTKDNRDSFFCDNTNKYLWINGALASLTVKNNKTSVNVCVMKFCKSLALNEL